MAGPDPEGASDALRQRFGDDFKTGDSVRELHGRDEGFPAARQPMAVLFAASAEDAAEAVAICARHRIAIIPFGTGSGQEGGVTAPRGGLSINTSRLDRILEINVEDQDCWVEAGVTRMGAGPRTQGDGPVLPRRPGRGRVARRDGGDRRRRHDDAPLRRDARERHGPRGRARGRDGDLDG